jgi:hypothetical protein
VGGIWSVTFFLLVIEGRSPKGYPGPGCTLYALASLRARAAEVKRVLLRLLARLGVDRNLAYRYPAVVAGVGALVVVILILSGWVRWVRGRLLRGHGVLSLGPCLGVFVAPPGLPTLSTT